MKIELIFFLGVLLFVVLGFASRKQSSGGGGGGGGLLAGGYDVDGALRKYGVTCRSSYRAIMAASDVNDRGGVTYGFTGVDKAGIEVSGNIVFTDMGPAMVTFDSTGAGARIARAHGRLQDDEQADQPALDPEDQVRREVSRRLDAMQANRADFLANDKNSDGVVDADEWAEARAQIEADVRREIGETVPEPAQPVPQVVPADDEGW